MRTRRSLASACLASSLLLASAAGAAVTMRYPLDKNHSTIGFAASILKVSKVTGKFSDFQGVILAPDKGDLTTATVQVTIKTASIDTGIDDRDAHLRSDEFFAAERHPEITFTSKQVRKVGDAWAVDGTLTMRGVGKEVTIPFRLRDWSDVIAAEAIFTLNRKDYGVSWSRVMDDGALFVDDEVEIHLFLLTRVGTELKPGEVAQPTEKKDEHH